MTRRGGVIEREAREGGGRPIVDKLVPRVEYERTGVGTRASQSTLPRHSASLVPQPKALWDPCHGIPALVAQGRGTTTIVRSARQPATASLVGLVLLLALRFVRRAWNGTRRPRGPVAANGRAARSGANQRSRARGPAHLAVRSCTLSG